MVLMSIQASAASFYAKIKVMTDASLQWRHNECDGLTVAYSRFYLGADQRKHQSSVSLAFVREFTGNQWIACKKGQ